MIAGLQETRAVDTSSYDSTYIRLIGQSNRGHGGVELWLSTSIPFAWRNQQSLYINRQCVQVLLSEAELLLVEVMIGTLPLLCCVGHAPHKGYASSDISDWWLTLRTHLQKFLRGRYLILFLDANASVAHCDPYTGDVDQQEQDTAGNELLQLCETFNLFIPSTFSAFHAGSSATWYSGKSPRGWTSK